MNNRELADLCEDIYSDYIDKGVELRDNSEKGIRELLKQHGGPIEGHGTLYYKNKEYHKTLCIMMSAHDEVLICTEVGLRNIADLDPTNTYDLFYSMYVYSKE